MKVKLFQYVVGVSAGNTKSGDFGKLEEQINAFLDENPEIQPIDLKLTSHAAAVGNLVTNYSVVAVLMYEQK